MDGMEDAPYVIAGIPSWNEELTIGSLVHMTKRFVDEVVVVDDGSSDFTLDIARDAGATVIPHIVNLGKGEGIRDIFEYARNKGVDALVLIDADGQHNPEDIPIMIEPILSGEVDMTIGSRFLESDAVIEVPKHRILGNKILTIATNFGSETKIKDTQSGFRAFGQSTFDIFSFQENSLSIESEMLVEAQEEKVSMKEVQVYIRYDVPKASKQSSARHGFGVLNRVLKVIAQTHPLLFFGTVGLVFMTIGFFSGVVMIWEFISGPEGNSFPVVPSIFTIVFLFLGIQIMMSGLILNQVNYVLGRRVRSLKDMR